MSLVLKKEARKIAPTVNGKRKIHAGAKRMRSSCDTAISEKTVSRKAYLLLSAKTVGLE